MNDDPILELTIGGEQFEMNRRNAFLFTFIGNLAVHDHVFVLTHPEESTGSFIFRHNEAFESLAKYMVENLFTAHINMQAVAQCDMDAWENSVFNDLKNTDSFPDDWEAA